MQRDLTTGSIFKTVIYFSLPYLLSYFLQTLYGMADLFIVGQFGGVSSTTAVSIGSQIMHMLTVMIVGLAMGATVMIGRCIGAKDYKKASETIGNTATMFMGIAIILMIVLLAAVRPIVSVMSTPAEAVEGTIRYLTICFIGIPFITAYNIISAIFRGILFLVPSSMLSTISALASQNIGAGKHDRARLTLRYVLCMTVGYGLVAATIVQFVSVPFVGLFTNDGAVQILGGQYLRSYAWDCGFAGVHFCLSGYFYAYGLSIVSFIHNSISIICARIPLSYYAATHFPDTLFPMGCAAPAGSIISIIICVGVLIWMNRHSEKYMGN